ncbi:MAG: hypothetical protein BWK76_28580 [Desulfobulbaceae bacterium A2]|nr:MAG: hypothetical protein BWK76_28580 [Desulfobulbaceae bacterium A2]
MQETARAMVLASFIGDSLALGAHWIYDTAQIDKQLGRVDQLLRPLPGSYHPNRDAGEFTHYGDQTLVLLESLAETKGFALEHFGAAWRKLFTNYDGYLDKATKQTLENITNNPALTTCGSGSTDLSAAARIAPLAYLFRDDQQQLVASAVAQARMTHNSPASLAAAEFLAKLVFQALHGVPLAEAVETALDDGVADLDLDLRLRASLDLVGQESRAAIARLGQMCGAVNALPAVLQLVLTHENDLEQCLIENVMAGGDSAARGLAAGMILGARLGMEAIPARWLAALRQRGHIEQLLTQLP